jgi:superkiller protein 3
MLNGVPSSYTPAGASQDERELAGGLSGRQNTEERIQQLRAAARRSPQSAEVHNELGLALGETGDLNAALAELQLATQLDGGCAQANYNLGITYVKRARLERQRNEAAYYQDLDSALQAFRRAYRLAPNLPKIHEHLGWLDQEIGDFTAALGELQLAVQENPGSAEAYNSLGAALGSARKSDEAIKAYEKAVELDPHLVAAELNLESEVQLRETPSSILEARRAAIRQQPASALAHALLGHSLYFSDRITEGTGELRKAVELDPDLAIAHFYLGEALMKSGDLSSAADQLGTAVNQSPNVVEFRIELGLALLQLSKLDESIAMLRGAAEQAPDSASAHYSLARALQRAGLRKEAAKEFTEADGLQQAERDREEAGLHTINGIQSLRTGNINDAVESLRRAVTRKPDYPEANYYLGIALAQSGDEAGSIRAFRTALEKRPRSAEIHYNFGIALRQMGKSSEAIQEFRQATQLKPEDGLAHCALGMALLQAGDSQTGEEELQLAHQLGACKPNGTPVSR